MSIGKKLEDLENYKKELDKLKATERDVLKPTLEDLSLIPIIYSWVLELCATREEIKTKHHNNFHYFLLVIGLLYSPGVFIGIAAKRGLRNKIAETVSLKPSTISNSLRSVCNWYKYYKDLRISLDYLYSEILLRIEIYKKV